MPKEMTASEEYTRAQEQTSLERVFNNLDKKGDGKIDPDELYDYLRYLGHKCRRVDCENMIWEVDENNDGGVDWDEFVTMFYRAKDDELGWEPRKLYNIVDFMMVDKDCSGTIDVDECMEILYRRFGKNDLEAKVNEFMALDTDDDDEPSIGFAEYMVGINKLSQIPDPGFKISQGMVLTTKEEIRKLVLDINSTVTTGMPPRPPGHSGTKKR